MLLFVLKTFHPTSYIKIKIRKNFACKKEKKSVLFKKNSSFSCFVKETKDIKLWRKWKLFPRDGKVIRKKIRFYLISKIRCLFLENQKKEGKK